MGPPLFGEFRPRAFRRASPAVFYQPLSSLKNRRTDLTRLTFVVLWLCRLDVRFSVPHSGQRSKQRYVTITGDDSGTEAVLRFYVRSPPRCVLKRRFEETAVFWRWKSFLRKVGD